MQTSRQVKRVSVVAIPRALGSSITIPLEMLSAANDIARAKRELAKLVELQVVGIGNNEITLAGGLQVKCQGNICDNDKCDLIFVPAVWRKPKQAVKEHRDLIRWLKQQHSAGATLCAATSGVYFLAETGLLKNKPATTHWRYFNEFSKAYPEVRLQRKRFTTNSDRIYCTGSVNAIRDIMLHFIAELYGTSIANEIAQHFTHELKPSFESLSLSKNQEQAHHDELIISVQEWLQNSFQDQLQIADIADKFGLSTRSLNRRFKQATNTTPLQYLQHLRLEHAKSLLKHSNLIIAEVADTVGYQDTSYFAEIFKKANDVTPNEYRQLVRNKLFVADSKQPNP